MLLTSIKFNAMFYVYCRLKLLERNDEQVIVESGKTKVVVLAYPFKIKFYEGQNEVAILNSRGLFALEHLRVKPNE